MTVRSCTTCEFAEPIAGGDDGPRTECRRYPPQVFTLVYDDGVAVAAQTWPNTYQDGWCGEWRPSPTLEAIG